MSKNVTVIPPSEKKPDTLRVAAYCRVSSDSSDQLHSYASQIRKYTEEISHHQGWELVDIYADEGLTGTRMEQREDFNRMMADCRKGRIDKVLVKSVSRFARNTKDCLAALRELMSLGVTVYFEKENINTETLTTELMVSVSGALAQQESISTSQNQRISYKRRMERGEFITCKAPYGYRIKDGKNLEIHEKEAAIIRLIFTRYLSGESTTEIAAALTDMGLRTRDGKEQWNIQMERLHDYEHPPKRKVYWRCTVPENLGNRQLPLHKKEKPGGEGSVLCGRYSPGHHTKRNV